MQNYRQKQKLSTLTIRPTRLTQKFIDGLSPFDLLLTSRRMQLTPNLMSSKTPLMSQKTSYSSINKRNSDISIDKNKNEYIIDDKNRYNNILDDLKYQISRDQSFSNKNQRKKSSVLCNKIFEEDKNKKIHRNQIPSLEISKINKEENQCQKLARKKVKNYSIQMKIQRSKTIKKKLQNLSPILNYSDFIQYKQIPSSIQINQKLQPITAQAVSVIKNGKRVYSFKGDQVRQIASITKVMTCLVTIYLCKKYQIDINSQKVKISSRAASIQGTSACLRYGDILTIDALLYGLILPSGNDAATALAQFFHKYMLQKQRKLKRKNQQLLLQNDKQKSKNQRTHFSGMFSPYSQGCDRFIKQMNKMAEYLNLKNTRFNNPHGLSDRYNVSTANNVADLSLYAMQIPQFRKYVKAKIFQTSIFNSHKKIARNNCWQNTNKLLQYSQCLGVKTGTTPNAGHTMSSYFQSQNNKVIAVVLHTRTKQQRFSETRMLYQWCKQCKL